MNERIEFSVVGDPVPQDRRTRTGKTRAGKTFTGTYLIKKVREWRQSILFAARRAEGFPEEPWTFAVRVTIEAYFSRPERLKKANSPRGPIRKNTKPDYDNLIKSVCDALTPPRPKRTIDNEAIRAAMRRGYLWMDDGQAHGGPVDKWYVEMGKAPGIIVTIERIHDEAGHEQLDLASIDACHGDEEGDDE